MKTIYQLLAKPPPRKTNRIGKTGIALLLRGAARVPLLRMANEEERKTQLFHSSGQKASVALGEEENSTETSISRGATDCTGQRG